MRWGVSGPIINLNPTTQGITILICCVSHKSDRPASHCVSCFDEHQESGLTHMQNGVLQIYSFFLCLVGSLWCDKIGRRRLFLVSTAGTLKSINLLIMRRDPHNSHTRYALDLGSGNNMFRCLLTDRKSCRCACIYCYDM